MTIEEAIDKALGDELDAAIVRYLRAAGAGGIPIAEVREKVASLFSNGIHRAIMMVDDSEIAALLDGVRDA